MPVETIRWDSSTLSIVDQTLLPGQLKYIPLQTTHAVWEAIKSLRVRGAPAIGICAAFGVLVGLQENTPTTRAQALKVAHQSADYLATSRPTAINLFWALDRMRHRANAIPSDATPSQIFTQLQDEAQNILEEDQRLCRRIGQHGQSLIKEGDGILTHCNAGALATADYGTALALMFSAHQAGRSFQVYADETRPLLQGARLTTWELMHEGIDVTLICDNMAAQVMREGKIQLVIVGSDRIAANGDAANKIGTYGVALLAHAHQIPFYVAAPTSTIDPNTPTGQDIPIEQRDPQEITSGFGTPTAPQGVKVYNPAFDVTPAHLITAIITEHGILLPPYTQTITQTIGQSPKAQPGPTHV